MSLSKPENSHPSPYRLDVKRKSGLRRDEVVEQHLLEQITSGVLSPGTKLPSTADLAAEMGVNINSVQKALMRLSARDFLTRRTNLGTFVSHRDSEPQNVFLLVGPCLREETCHFDRRVSKLIEAELFARGYNPVIYDGLDQILDRDSPVGQRLERQLTADLTHFSPRAIIEQNFVSLRLPQLVRWGAHQIVSLRPLVQGGDVSFDFAHFHAEAVRAIAERKRKNVVLALKKPRVCFDSLDLEAFWSAAREHSVNVEKLLHIEPGPFDEQSEESLEEALTAELKEWKRLPPTKRWDSLVVTDDVLMRAVARCLLREGISVPDDILPVSLVNEGIRFSYGVPVVGIETPLPQIASKLVDILDVRLGRTSGPDPAPVQLKGRVVESGFQDRGPDPSVSVAASRSRGEQEYQRSSSK